MGFRTGSYATVWKVEKGNGNYFVAEMSTSRKNSEGKYENDWSNKFVRLVGTAAEQAKGLKERDRVKIGDCDVTNHYDSEKKIMYTNYVIFNFSEDDTGAKSSPKKTAKTVDDETYVNVPVGANEELPFV